MNNKYEILKRFPEIKLSCDNNLHRKVYSDIYLLIPKGTRSFLWFTYDDNKNVCYLLELNKYNVVADVKKFVVCFNSVLSYNTIIYGTFFVNNNINHFTCEDIFYFKGDNVGGHNFLEKLKLLKLIFTDNIKQVYYTSDSLLVGLPFFSPNQKEVFAQINSSNYYINCIQFRNYMESSSVGIMYNNVLPQSTCAFKLKANVTADMYELYCNNNKFYGYALISNYVLSVKMNSIFRKIRENSNLDLLEESDDEADFENILADKHVDLDKSIYMTCVYNKKFRKWVPKEQLQTIPKLANYNEIQLLEKK